MTAFLQSHYTKEIELISRKDEELKLKKGNLSEVDKDWNLILQILKKENISEEKEKNFIQNYIKNVNLENLHRLFKASRKGTGFFYYWIADPVEETRQLKEKAEKFLELEKSNIIPDAIDYLVAIIGGHWKDVVIAECKVCGELITSNYIYCNKCYYENDLADTEDNKHRTFYITIERILSVIINCIDFNPIVTKSWVALLRSTEKSGMIEKLKSESDEDQEFIEKNWDYLLKVKEFLETMIQYVSIRLRFRIYIDKNDYFPQNLYNSDSLFNPNCVLRREDTSRLYIVTNRHILMGKVKIPSTHLSITFKEYSHQEEDKIVKKSKEIIFECQEGKNIFYHPKLDICLIDLNAIEEDPKYGFEISKLTYSAFTKGDIPDDSVNNNSGLYETSEVFMTGYPKGLYSTSALTPITRNGSLTTSYSGNWKKNENAEFLTNIPVFNGSSGSPVYHILSAKERKSLETHLEIFLLGIFRSSPRYKIKNGIYIPMSLGINVKAKEIDVFASYINNPVEYVKIDVKNIKDDEDEETCCYEEGFLNF